jgi:hypothetical protein
MTHRHDTHIRVKPNSLIQAVYSGRTYVFSTGIIQYAVSPDDVEIIDYD